MSQMHFDQKLGELSALIQEYLLGEYAATDWIQATPESYQFFKEYFSEHRPKQKRPPPQPVEEVPQQPLPVHVVKPLKPQPQTQTPIKKTPQKTAESKPPPAKHEKSPFTWKPKGEVNTIEMGDIHKTVTHLFPHYPLLNEIPNDQAARAHTLPWREALVNQTIVVFSFDEHPTHKEFLKKMTQAISMKISPATLISAPTVEQEKGWEELLASSKLRLIIGSDYALYTQPGLMEHYRENTHVAHHYLKEKRLFLLPDISLYLKQPKLKISLWKAIQATAKEVKT